MTHRDFPSGLFAGLSHAEILRQAHTIKHDFMSASTLKGTAL
jgi:hypothetical protein